jgi:hypothetical protein
MLIFAVDYITCFAWWGGKHFIDIKMGSQAKNVWESLLYTIAPTRGEQTFGLGGPKYNRSGGPQAEQIDIIYFER